MGAGVRTGTGVAAGCDVAGRAVGVSGGSVCSRPTGADDDVDDCAGAAPPLQFGGHRGPLSGAEDKHLATMWPCCGSRQTGVPEARTA
jgi:hypothetical protein